MADITKRTGKRLAAHLENGESVRVALFVEPKGTYGLGAFALAAAPRTTMRRMDRKARERHGEEGGIAAGFPGRSSVIAVTDRRILVAPTNGLKFEAPELTVPLGSMFVQSMARRGMGRRIELVFSDGSGVEVDAQRLQPFDEFADTVGRAP